MRLKDSVILRQLADIHIAIPQIDDVWELSHMLTLNETGLLLWSCLEKQADMDTLVSTLVSTYGIEESLAREDAESFCQTLKQAGFLTN